MTIIKKENWFKINGKPYIECPVCFGLLLGPDAPHRIDSNGVVSRSVVCRGMKDLNGFHVPCTFHDYVTLEGWSEVAID